MGPPNQRLHFLRSNSSNQQLDSKTEKKIDLLIKQISVTNNNALLLKNKSYFFCLKYCTVTSKCFLSIFLCLHPCRFFNGCATTTDNCIKFCTSQLNMFFISQNEIKYKKISWLLIFDL